MTTQLDTAEEFRGIIGKEKGRLQRYETRIEERVRARKSQRLQPAFYAIHKRSIQENNDAQVQVQRRLIEETTSMDTNMAKRRLKLREEQTAREREHTDHAIMLKELQRLLFEGRTFHENFEDNLEKVMREAAQAHVSMEYESKIQNLTQELDEVRKRLLVSEEKLKLISPLLIKMHQLVEEQRHAELETEKKQPGHCVTCLHQQTVGSRTQLGSLTNRPKDDWLCTQDCAAIQQIQERPSLLTREDATSSSSARIGPKTTELSSQQIKPEREDIAGPFWQQARAAETVEAACAESPMYLLAHIRELAGEDVLSLYAKWREKLRHVKD
ncbi:GRIP and coiled-coil domain-containing protein 1-like [Rhipicephalus sanguineus]|uniref:GRIP and coiled-coil domain-containing protein 1-like n=1 Tax=Rhipicephalus sanguineus TaxID=34632 RepID=UPI001895624D|nr:GRIP and coiled-coil domain-containing protein 1-like [Rhipicephalus sanguineus]